MKKPKFSVSYRACLGKDDDGKYHYKRFTGTSNASEARALEDAKRQAERWKVLHEQKDSATGLSLREACAEYICAICAL